MSRIKYIAFILIVILFAQCGPGSLARRHLPALSKAGEFKYGGWIIATQKVAGSEIDKNQVCGELIALQDHLLYILDTQKVSVIRDTTLVKAKLYKYKTRPEIFAIVTIISIIPNLIAAALFPEYSGEFLALAAAPLIAGTIFTVSESATTRNQLIYPRKNTLQDFNEFSRFPQGIPPGVDLHQIKLP